MQGKILGLIGYGEVGRIFGAGLRSRLGAVHAWDLKLLDVVQAAPLRERAGRDDVRLAPSMAALCAASNFIVSAVTASSALEVARNAAQHLRPGTVFLDLNSASPGTKRDAAATVEQAGGCYVEAGVMTSVPLHGIRVPMLLGGPHAEAVAAQLRGLGIDAQAVSAELGLASAIKMCRSVMIKGLEALVIESYTAARALGVEEHVLPTLQETFPGLDWSAQGRYFFSRVVRHGRRRAEEMQEVARTVREAGFEPWMSAATARKQAWVAAQAAAGTFDALGEPEEWFAYADRLIEASRKDNPT